MRRAIYGIATLLVAGYGYLHFSGRAATFENALGERVSRFIFAREIRFRGLTLLAESDLGAILPRERSNFWWLWNRSAIARRLEEEKLIERARVDRCADPAWGCFEIAVIERLPEFVAQVGDKAWLVGADGAFIGRAPLAALDPKNPPSPTSPVIIQGIDVAGGSPDVARARFDIVRSAIEVIETGSGETVRSAKVLGARDLEVSFRDRGFTVTFGLPDGDTARLQDEVARFARLDAELGPRQRLVKSIDLAFERMAVVKFVE